MARTKRIYNKKGSKLFIHPYFHVCMGNCPRCKDRKQDYKYKRKRERQELKFDFKEVLKK
ncbi:MAG: hypothetical protein ACTSRR_09845 [Candidatus Heimdallarchaeaceae archaeon]